MAWGWICPGILIVALMGWAIYRGSVYRRLFAEDHFLEVAHGLARVKSAALEKSLEENDKAAVSPTDPRVLLTSAGLALLYTIDRSENQFIHHYSVSVSGGYTAHAVGEMFTLFVAKLLLVPLDTLDLRVARSTVHHAGFQLTASEQSDFARRPLLDVSRAQIESFRDEYRSVREQLSWQPLEGKSASPGDRSSSDG